MSGQLQTVGALLGARASRAVIAGTLGFALLVACTPEQSAEERPAPEPIVVYAADKDRMYLPALFDSYTNETGVEVIVRYGDAPGIVDDVIDSRVSPVADLLLVPSVAEIWRAAEKGALRPIYSEFVHASVPKWLRDPDEFWVALSFQAAMIVYDPETINADLLLTYETLARPQFRHQVCLSSSSLPINHAVIAMLIDKLGIRETELTVRGWVANLAMPAFNSEQELLHAIGAGDCAIGIVSSGAATLAQGVEKSDFRLFTPAELYSNLEGLGVTRHARNPDGALALVEWLLSEKIQLQHASHTLSYAAISAGNDAKNVVLVGWRSEEAEKLAERVRYP